MEWRISEVYNPDDLELAWRATPSSTRWRAHFSPGELASFDSEFLFPALSAQPAGPTAPACARTAPGAGATGRHRSSSRLRPTSPPVHVQALRRTNTTTSPPPPPASSRMAGMTSDFEFIELQNLGPRSTTSPMCASPRASISTSPRARSSIPDASWWSRTRRPSSHATALAADRRGVRGGGGRASTTAGRT